MEPTTIHDVERRVPCHIDKAEEELGLALRLLQQLPSSYKGRARAILAIERAVHVVDKGLTDAIGELAGK